MYRVSVARTGRGPLNPVNRPSDPALARDDWSRFEITEAEFERVWISDGE